MAPDVLSLSGVAAELGVSYDWLQRHWRTLPGFPPPYLGGRPGERPRWWRQAIADFKAGRFFLPADPVAVAPSAAFPAANDTAPRRADPDVDAVLAAMGC
jgi:hypothetical protein